MEDLLLGRTFTTEPRAVPDPVAPPSSTEFRFDGLHTRVADSGPLQHSSYGLTSLLTAISASGVGWRLVECSWHQRRPVTAGRPAHHQLTVTRVRGDNTEGTRINAQVNLLDEHGEVVEHGTCIFSATTPAGAEAEVQYQFGTVEWGRHLIPFLERDRRFTNAIESYDGTIGIGVGSEEVQFRLYRGSVLEATRRAIHGADFTLSADEIVWTELILSDRNNFMDRAMQGQFRTKGSGYEYLRMTKALIYIVDAARVAVAR